MGTFHSDKGDLHGVTVVVDTPGPRVFIGRCDEIRPDAVILHDAELHEETPGTPTKEEFVQRAARVGHWPKLPRVAIPWAEVASIRRLGEVVSA